MSSSSIFDTSGKTASIAILIGSGGGGVKGGLGPTTVPLVVWTLRERRKTAEMSPWKYDLVYYEFLDDIARWTHLDQLLMQLCDDTSNEENDLLPSIHLGSSENLERIVKKNSNNKNNKFSQSSQHGSSSSPPATASSKQNSNGSSALARTQKLVRSLETFLDERLFRSSNNNDNAHLHHSVPVDPSKVEASLSYLLVPEEGARLTVRGDVRLSQPLIRQGLALWLQSQGLYGTHGSSTSSSGGAILEGSLQVLPGQLSSHLVMDSTAASAIHLLPPKNDGEAVIVGGNRHNNSLLGLLSGPCLTSMGKRQLQVWLRQPLVNLEQIQKRQDAVTQLLGMAKDSIRDGLRPFGGSSKGSGLGNNLARSLAKYRVAEENDDGNNNDESVGRIVDTKKPLEALYHLYVLASNHLPHLLDCMECLSDEDEDDGNNDSNESSSPILKDLYQQVTQLVAELQRSVGLAEAVLNLEKAPEEFLVKPEYDEVLEELSRELETVHSSVKDEHEAIQDAWNDVQTRGGKSTQVRLERVEDNTAWQFRLPDANDSKMVQNVGQKIKTHRILKNGVYFSSLELRQLSAKYQDLQSEYNQLSRKIVRDAMSIASTYSTVVERAADAIGVLDVFCSLAHTAAMSPHGYCKPNMTDSDEDNAGIKLEGARHPCVELQENIDYIPNDINLTFPKAQLLVSGPNMGGKSVYIRSLGAIVCMAQIGSYVPCTSATINICHSILARVGAGDLQERGISTFMAEMLESSAILRAATKRSLIIIDELGRGTSTFDGYGLARAILEYLMDRVGCIVVFATHFHELTHLPRVKNCHVTAQKGSQGLTFLYAVKSGACSESFGIQVAEMAHVPRAVIEDAKKRARELESFSKEGTEGDNDQSKRSKISNDQKILQRFAGLDLPSIMKEISSLSPEAKQARLASLVSP